MYPYSENIKINKKGITFTDKHGKSMSLNMAVNKAIIRIINILKDAQLFLVHLVSLHVPIHSIRKAVFKFAGVKIGRGTTIHMGCRFFNPLGVEIGEDTKVGNNAFLDGRAQLKIGDHVDIASEVMIYNSEHNIEDPEFKAVEEFVKIKDYCFVGPRAIILPGVTVGRGSVIAAGAVVTKSVDDYQIVAGIPAVVIGTRKNKNLDYKLGRARLFQ